VENKKRITVGLFGFYNEDNWGDDLMAGLFFRALRQKHINVCVYKTSEANAYFKGMQLVDSPEELVRQSSLLIYGGGGILATKQNDESAFAKVIERITSCAREAGKEIYLISVGGVGAPPDELPRFVQQLIRQAKQVTVRNPQDLITVQSLNPEVQFFHDIVWLAPEYFQLPEPSDGRSLVAINIAGGRDLRFAGLLRLLFRFVGMVRTGSDLIFIDSQKVSSVASAHGQGWRFSSPEADIAMIEKLTCVVSNKLHFGLACMSYGKPFLSVLGHGKTKLMLQNIGLDAFVYNWPQTLCLLMKTLLYGSPNNSTDILPVDIEAIKRSATGHLHVCEEIIANHAVL